MNAPARRRRVGTTTRRAILSQHRRHAKCCLLEADRPIEGIHAIDAAGQFQRVAARFSGNGESGLDKQSTYSSPSRALINHKVVMCASGLG